MGILKQLAFCFATMRDNTSSLPFPLKGLPFSLGVWNHGVVSTCFPMCAIYLIMLALLIQADISRLEELANRLMTTICYSYLLKDWHCYC